MELDGVCIPERTAASHRTFRTSERWRTRLSGEAGYQRKLSGKAQKAGRRGPLDYVAMDIKIRKRNMLPRREWKHFGGTGDGGVVDSSWKEMYRLSSYHGGEGTSRGDIEEIGVISGDEPYFNWVLVPSDHVLIWDSSAWKEEVSTLVPFWEKVPNVELRGL